MTIITLLLVLCIGVRQVVGGDPAEALVNDKNGLSLEDLHYIEKSMNRLNFIQKKLLNIDNKTRLHMDESTNITKRLGPEQLPLLFEGDMLLTPRQMNGILQNVEHQLFLKDIGRLDLLEHPKNRRHKRTLIANPIARWTEMPIPYRIMEERGTSREAVQAGIRIWEQNTCLTFQEKTGHFAGPHIQFIRGSGCYSNVGRSSLSGQYVSIGRGCENPLIVAHEIGHSLGFFHEQSRFDRDKYIRIDSSNIHSAFYNQFTKQQPDMLQTYDVEYDIDKTKRGFSFMHYDQYSFSFTGNPAIRALDPNYQDTMGQRHEITFNDVKKINSAYCGMTCPRILACQNSGYTDPHNCKRCRCPSGLGGRNCAKPKKSKTDCGPATIRQASTIMEQLEFGGQFGECNFLIRSAEGTKIQLRIEELQFLPSLPCKSNYLEIKYGKDMGTTGARFCERTAAMPNIISRTNQVLIMFRSTSSLSRFRISYSSDEPSTPFNVFTNSFAIFSEFFRGFFRNGNERTSAEDEDTYYEGDLEEIAGNFSQSVDKNDSSAVQSPKPSIPKRRPISDFEGSGIDEIAAEGFIEHNGPVLIGDDESLLNELVPVETRRKPIKKIRKPAKLEYEIVEGSGASE